MAKFNPDFWETTISQKRWNTFANEDNPYYEDPAEIDQRQVDATHASALGSQLHTILEENLTPKQREVVALHFFANLNQRQIAEKLGISQQAVSEHLYGKTRGGRKVGGALRKLRKACEQRGVRWPP